MTQPVYMPHSTEATSYSSPVVSDALPAFIPERNVPAEIARSWLLVNALKTELFDQSAVSRADSIILDIEDAGDPSQKDQARNNVIDWLAFRLAFGSGDFRRDTGMAATPEAMAYPRAKLVAASRVGNLPGPIDAPTVGTNHPILREQTGITVTMGMTGKLCLAIDQTPVIHEVVSPTPSDVAWATDLPVGPVPGSPDPGTSGPPAR